LFLNSKHENYQSTFLFVSKIFFSDYLFQIDMYISGNAGIMACPYSKTVDGFESQFGVNHLAHYLLTTSLIPELKAGKPSRVVVVSSLANKRAGINWDDINWEKNYDKWLAYSQSKTANILFAKQLNKLYASEGIQAYSLHPGGILTNLQQHVPIEEQRAMGWYKEDGTLVDLFKNVEQGASTSIYAALAPDLDNHGGEYLEDCAISKGVNPDKTYWGMAPHSLDMEAAERLWILSEQMVAAK
jgi:NAD(P)-dependent dehydrogenase (short-subunit alcohol dehydrogenase family)